jgi:excisionase family DNA binding protein
MSRLLSPSDVAAVLRISRSAVSRLTTAGSLPSVRVGRLVRIPADSLDQFIADRVVEHEPRAVAS